MPSGEPRALAARTAWAAVLAYPLYAVAATRHHAVANAANPNRHPPNTLRHERSLSDHLARWITTPNNDTLYANAWVDLSAGPVQLQVQQMPAGRHWSVALLDAWTNHVAVVGQHVAACGPLTLNLAGTGAGGGPCGARRRRRVPRRGERRAGRFGDHHRLRALVALGGLGALPPEEAVYFVRAHDAPADARLRANWLPAPAGPFQVALRAYLPRQALRAGSAPMPAILPA